MPTVPALRRLVRAALDGDPAVDPLSITIEFDEQMVLLQGEVGSHAERLAATRAVSRVHAVERIDNRLTVRATDMGPRASDAVIAAAVADALAAEGDVSGHWSGVVTATVDQHVVELRGHLDSTQSRARARHVAEQVDGVDFVDNLITIDPT